MLSRKLVVLGVTVAVLVGAGPAAAATITVNTTGDDNNQGDGQCSLRKAIADVNSPGSGQTDCAPAAFGANTIMLGAGTYTLGFVSSSDLAIAPTVRNLTIAGEGQGKTFIDAGPLGNRVFEIGAGASAAINDLTVENGHAPGGTAGPSGSPGTSCANGGAILNAGTLTTPTRP
jgi:CSLREA domain-containing protein